MINKSKKLKFLQSREQWKTTNSNKEDNWSEMIQNLENEEGVCLSQFFFNKPKSQTPSVHLSSLLISQKPKRQVYISVLH